MLQVTLCLALMAATSLGLPDDPTYIVHDIVPVGPADTADTVDTADTGDTADTADTAHKAHTADDTAHTADDTAAPEDHLRHAIVMEANSGHTTLRYYTYEETATDTFHFSNMREVNSMKVTPGIHKFKVDLTYNGQTIQEYLQPLMVFALDIHTTSITHEETVHDPTQHQHLDTHTQVMLFATGGMRLLEVEELTPIIDEVRRLLNDPTFNTFGFSGNEFVKILSGEEEAAFAWVAVNYLGGFFHSDKPSSESYGVMEMGHESTQIAFVPDETIKAGFYSFNLGGKTYELYVHSYEQYGIGGMTDIMAEDFEVLRNATDDDVAEVDNTCWVRGINDTRTFVNGTHVRHVGGGDPMACMKVIQKHLLTPDAMEEEFNLCLEKKCRVRNVYQPDLPQNMTFWATHGFQHAAMDLNWRLCDDGVHNYHMGVLGNDNETLDVIKLMTEGFRYCSLTADEVRVHYPHIKEEHVGKRCFMALYLSNLLSVYDTTEASDRILATTTINHQPVTWALGALVMRTYERLGETSTAGSYTASQQQQLQYVHAAHNTAYSRGYAYGWPPAVVE